MRRLARGARNTALRRVAAVRRGSHRRRRRRHLAPIGVVGPTWLAWLLAPDARIVEPGGRGGRPLAVVAAAGSPAVSDPRWVGLPRLDYDPEAHPLVQPRRSNPVVAEVPPHLPTVLRDAASAACRTVTAPSPAPGVDPRQWLTETAQAHAAYREAQRAAAGGLVAAALQGTGREPPGHSEELTAVCVTNRPAMLDRLLANVARQRDVSLRLVLVLNSEAFDRRTVDERIATIPTLAPSTSIVEVDEAESLGTCLNVALDRCETRYLAKMDDDDTYGPSFLVDLLLAHRYADAAVVGKHSYFASFDDSPVLHLRFPGREFTYTSFVAGGTLLVDLERIGSVRFPDRSVGEDSAFLEACQRRGLGVFAADRFSYVQHRGGSNTWAIDRGRFLSGAIALDPGSPAAVVDP